MLKYSRRNGVFTPKLPAISASSREFSNFGFIL